MSRPVGSNPTGSSIYGTVAERLIAPVSKAGVGNTTVGSNPTGSAKYIA